MTKPKTPQEFLKYFDVGLRLAGMRISVDKAVKILALGDAVREKGGDLTLTDVIDITNKKDEETP